MGGNWIIGLGAGEHSYKIGTVTYIVTSHFAEPGSKHRQTLTDKMKSFIGSDFADLTAEPDPDIIDTEYVRSAAGKEDACSRNQN